jgi:hypothetical protein
MWNDMFIMDAWMKYDHKDEFDNMKKIDHLDENWTTWIQSKNMVELHHMDEIKVQWCNMASMDEIDNIDETKAMVEIW